MPWTAKDAPSTVEGKNRAKWASIANAIYRECMKTGTDKTCAGKAKRIANSKFNEGIKMSKKEIPNGALRFVSSGAQAYVQFSEDNLPSLKMIAYSGKIIKDHFWWGNLAIDLNGMKFPKNIYPILENHDTSRKIAFTGKPIVGESLEIDSKTTKFVDTEESREFQKLSSEGFPFEASIYAKPSVVERVAEDSTVEVNGYKFKGPGTIWRQCEFKEASVCVFGWDTKTSASAFSRDVMTELEFEEIGGDDHNFEHESGFDKLNNEEVNEMPKTIEGLQEKYPDLVQKLTEQITGDLSAKHAQELKDRDDKISQLTSENEKQVDRIDQLEKKDIIRTEKEIKSEAMHIVNAKLAATDIPERLYDKIKRLVKHDKFVKDDVLDTEAYSKFVDDEIKDFEEIGVTKTVLGMGRTSRDDVDDNPEEKFDKEDDEAVDALLKMTGDLEK